MPPYGLDRLERIASPVHSARAMALIRRKTKKEAKKVAKKVAKRYWPLGVAAVVLLVMVAAWMVAPASEWTQALGKAVHQLGWAAPVIYFLLYILGTLVLAPSPMMTIAARSEEHTS